jgi:NADP-dependent 3-hydroxy acid dehydrogenase YdfG
MSLDRSAVVTGASSGIGRATVVALAAQGFHVRAGARRTDRLRALASQTGATAMALDVTDSASVERFCGGLDRCNALVCSAGGALGRDTVEQSRDTDWQAMYEVNVMGTVRVVRALLPALRASGSGHIVLVGSIAGHQAYPGGGGYNAAKFAVRAVRDVLRQELLGEPIRVSEVAPGMVDTEFSLVRFAGDEAKATATYAGMTPLAAEDVADCITWAVTRPPHVNIDTLVVLATDQADATTVHRHT